MISEQKFREIIIFGCEIYNLNKIGDAHEKWEEVWRFGDIIQKKAVRGLIQISGATIQFERIKMDSVRYLLKLAIKNLSAQEILNEVININQLVADLKKIIIKLENNNLKEFKINIKFQSNNFMKNDRYT